MKAEYKFSTVPDGKSSTVVNLTIELFKVVDSMKSEMKLSFPESETDTKYLRQIYRTRIDMTKVAAGLRGNAMIASLFGNILKSMNVKLDFPVKPGVYKFTNMSFSGRLLPPITSLFLLESKSFTKVQGKKRFVVAQHAKIYGKLN